MDKTILKSSNLTLSDMDPIFFPKQRLEWVNRTKFISC